MIDGFIGEKRIDDDDDYNTVFTVSACFALVTDSKQAKTVKTVL
jgi:hypothetical protein